MTIEHLVSVRAKSQKAAKVRKGSCWNGEEMQPRLCARLPYSTNAVLTSVKLR